MYRPFRNVLSLLLCAIVPALFGCQNGQDTAADAGKAGGNAAERAGAPPIPDNLSPEVRNRIA
ncbi:MAG: hypothetical protein H8F28_14980 [Fibrella sp.]|nr:hypothetical protein [Armatimonadota bacterium]